MFTFHSQFDTAEYVRADRATARYRLNGRWRNWFPLPLVAIFVLAFFAPPLFLGSPWPAALGQDAWMPVFVLGLPLLIYLRPILKARALRKSDPDLSQGYDRVIDDQGLKMVGRSATVTLSWERIKQVRETPEFFLFYVLPTTAYYLPRHAVAEPEPRASLRAYLRQQIGERAVLL